MSSATQALFDQSVLEMIEHSPVGGVPHTPTHQDALQRLYASHQIYASADHKDGHVTARSVALQPVFHASNVDALVAGEIEPDALESNESIFDRYVQSLPAELRARAETYRIKAAGRPIHHRKHHGTAQTAVIHDPVHTLFLVPGSGPNRGLPGNYLHGSVFEVAHGDGPVSWSVQLHDCDNGVASFDTTTLPEALEKLQEVLASGPFHLSELAALDFTTNIPAVPG